MYVKCHLTGQVWSVLPAFPLYDQDIDNNKIIIEDNGVGMSFKEVNDYFLRTGRNRRDEGFGWPK